MSELAVERARLLWGSVQAAVVVAVLAVDWMTDGVTALALFMGAVMAVGLLEFYRMAAVDTAHQAWGVAGVLALAAGPLVSRGQLAGELEWSAVVLVAFLLGLLLVDWLKGGLENQMTALAATALGLLYVWGLLAFVVRVGALPGVGILGVALLLAVAKGSDITAYYVGTRLGRLRLAPRVSPKKSLEGVIGALVVSMVLAVLLSWAFRLPLGLQGALVFAVLVSVGAQLGDLAESFLKRKLRAKDSGRLFPGFGGLLDVVDSLTGAAPVAFVLFRFLTVENPIR